MCYVKPMKITICGSMHFASEMKQVQADLEAMGHEVLVPIDTDVHVADPTLKDAGARETAHNEAFNVHHDHYEKIMASDAILVLNYDKKGIVGYIGASTTMEIGVASAHHKQIYVWQTPDPQVLVADDLFELSAIIIEQDLSTIRQ